MTDKELMDFSFDICRQSDYTIGEVLCEAGLKFLEWFLWGIIALEIGFILCQIFGSDEVCQCDHNLDDYY